MAKLVHLCSMIKKEWLSFGHAYRGIMFAFRQQNHMRIHGVAVIVVCLGAWYTKATSQEWGLLFLAFGLVLSLEMLNSALEALADALHPDPHPLIGRAKDMAAGAVLLAALMAVGVAVCVFIC